HQSITDTNQAMLPHPNPAVLFQPVAEGAILLHTEQEIYFGLNEVGAQIWQMLPPSCGDISEVSAELCRRYPDVEPSLIETDVSTLISELAEQGLVVAAAT